MSEEKKRSLKNVTLRIGDNLHTRLNNHIHLLKCLESRSHSKQRWIEEAAREKLENEEKLGEDYIPRDNFISFKMHTSLNDKIAKRIEIAKKFKVSYSAKQWYLEAIYEKLEREDKKAKKLIDDSKTNQK